MSIGFYKNIEIPVTLRYNRFIKALKQENQREGNHDFNKGQICAARDDRFGGAR